MHFLCIIFLKNKIIFCSVNQISNCSNHNRTKNQKLFSIQLTKLIFFGKICLINQIHVETCEEEEELEEQATILPSDTGEMLVL